MATAGRGRDFENERTPEAAARDMDFLANSSFLDLLLSDPTLQDPPHVVKKMLIFVFYGLQTSAIAVAGGGSLSLPFHALTTTLGGLSGAGSRLVLEAVTVEGWGALTRPWCLGGEWVNFHPPAPARSPPGTPGPRLVSLWAAFGGVTFRFSRSVPLDTTKIAKNCQKFNWNWIFSL